MFGFFSPFSMLTGAAVVFGYALLGACWLILKTEGELQKTARTLALPLPLQIARCYLVTCVLPGSSAMRTQWLADGRYPPCRIRDPSNS